MEYTIYFQTNTCKPMARIPETYEMGKTFYLLRGDNLCLDVNLPEAKGRKLSENGETIIVFIPENFFNKYASEKLVVKRNILRSSEERCDYEKQVKKVADKIIKEWCSDGCPIYWGTTKEEFEAKEYV